MSPFRPDLIDCWMFRVGMTPVPSSGRRSCSSSGRRGASCPACGNASRARSSRASGSPPARLRELAEETGFGPDAIEAFYDLDLVNQFHEPSYDAIVTSAVFAVRLKPGAEPRLSSEHDDARWHDLDEAHQQVIWPGYRTAIERIRDDLSEPERAGWFELTLDGARAGSDLGSPKLTRW